MAGHRMDLGKDPLGRLLLKFSLPLIANLLVGAAYDVLNRIYLGNAPGLGFAAVSAATAAYPLAIIANAMGQLTGLGAASLIATALGAGKRKDAELVLGQALGLSAGLALAAFALGSWLSDPLLLVLGTPAAVLPLAREYSRVLLFGFLFQVPAMALSSTLRAQARPQAMLYVSLAGGALNAALAPFFLYVLGWGISGAAWATVAAQAFSAAAALWWVQNGKSRLRLARGTILRPRFRVLASIAASGTPMAMMQALTIVVLVAANRSVAAYGNDWSLGVVGVAYTLAMVFSYPVIGVSQAAQSIWSYNMGARNYRRVERLLKAVLLWSAGLGTAAAAAAAIWPARIAALFGATEGAAVEAATRAIPTYMASFPVFCALIAAVHYFQAIGRIREPALLLVLKYSALVLAFALLPGVLGFDGVFAAGPLSDAAAGLLGLAFIAPAFRRLGILQERVREGTGLGTRA